MEIFEENISGLRNPFFPLKYLWLVERMVDMANNNDLHVHILVARFGLCLNFIATFDFLVFFLVNQIWVWLHLPFLTLAYLCRKASIWLCLIAIQFNSGFRTSPPMHWWRCPESWIELNCNEAKSNGCFAAQICQCQKGEVESNSNLIDKKEHQKVESCYKI